MKENWNNIIKQVLENELSTKGQLYRDDLENLIREKYGLTQSIASGLVDKYTEQYWN